MIPDWVSSALRAPYDPLSIHRHMRALTIVGSAHGRMTIERSSQRKRICWSMSIASPSPRLNSSAVVATVKKRAL